MSSLKELEGKYKITLPDSYKEWHQNGGQNKDSLIGTDVDFPRLSEIQDWAKELLTEDQSSFTLPDKAFVFLMHQGYQFMYFICNGNNDPQIWYYHEGDMEPKVKWETFSEYVSST